MLLFLGQQRAFGERDREGLDLLRGLRRGQDAVELGTAEREPVVVRDVGQPALRWGELQAAQHLGGHLEQGALEIEDPAGADGRQKGEQVGPRARMGGVVAHVQDVELIERGGLHGEAAVVEGGSDGPRAAKVDAPGGGHRSEAGVETGRVRHSTRDDQIDPLEAGDRVDHLVDLESLEHRLLQIGDDADDDLVAHAATAGEEGLQAAPHPLIERPVHVDREKEEVDAGIEGREHGLGPRDHTQADRAHPQAALSQRLPVGEAGEGTARHTVGYQIPGELDFSAVRVTLSSDEYYNHCSPQ